MVQSNASSIPEYLEEIGPEKAQVIQGCLACLRDAIHPEFEEVMNWGMITYQVPLEVFPETYNRKPLMYCALAAQKNYFSLYLMGAYGDSECFRMLESGFAAKGLKLKMGKCCLKFNGLESLDLPTLQKVVGFYSVESWIEHYQHCRTGKE